MNLKALQQRVQQASQLHAHTKAIIAGKTYDCNKTQLTASQKLTVLGEKCKYNFTILVSCQKLKTAPEARAILTVSGTQYKVALKPVKDVVEAKWIIHLEEK